MRVQALHLFGCQALFRNHSLLIGLKLANEVEIREELGKLEARAAIRSIVQLRRRRQVNLRVAQDIENPVPTLRVSEAHVLIERRLAVAPREAQLSRDSQQLLPAMFALYFEPDGVSELGHLESGGSTGDCPFGTDFTVGGSVVVTQAKKLNDEKIYRYWVEIRDITSGSVRQLPLTAWRLVCLKRAKKDEPPLPDREVLKLQDGEETWEAEAFDELRTRLRDKYPDAAFERTLHHVRDHEAGSGARGP